MDEIQKKIIVECKITAHASPKWKAARTELARVAENEVLARRRGDAAKNIFEQKMRAKLSDYQLDFKYDQSIVDDDSVPNNTMLIGTINRGQRDSIVAASGNRSNNDQAFRRVDMDVRIARKVDEQIPTEVVHKFKQPTKTKNWYVSVGAGISFHAGAGVTLLFVQLRNMWGQAASGVAYAAGWGGGVSGLGKLAGNYLRKHASELALKTLKNSDELRRLMVSVSFSDETSVVTDQDVGFSDFHGRTIGYTSASLQAVVGYEFSHISFWDMGDGAQLRPVGGLSIAPDVAASLNGGVGLLYLFNVPDDWIVQQSSMNEWNTYTSKWTTQHSLPLYFASGSADIGKAIPQIEDFTSKITKDFREQ